MKYYALTVDAKFKPLTEEVFRKLISLQRILYGGGHVLYLKVEGVDSCIITDVESIRHFH